MEDIERKNLLNRKIEYFCDIWNHYLHTATSSFSEMTLYSPHLLLKDIIDEYKYQKLNNDKNRNFLKKKIETYMKRDLIKKTYLIEFKKLNEAIGNKNYEIANEITKTLLEKFNTGKYFNNCFESLIDLMFNDDNNFSEIKTLTNDIIIEFMLKGKTLKRITKIISDIFDKITAFSDESNEIRYSTSFPIKSQNLTYEDIKTKEDSRNVINNLTDKQRIEAIRFLYNLKDMQFYVLFNIIGLKHYESKPFKIKNIEFYSYPKRKILNVDEDFCQENFGNKDSKETLNALVPVIASDEYIAEQLAREKLDSTLAMIKVINMGTPYYEIKDEYIVLNNLKKPIMVIYGKKDGTGEQIKQKINRAKYNPSDITNLMSVQKYAKDLLNAHMMLNKKRNEFTELEEKLYFSLKWINSAEDNENMEERLVDYWIAIENLVTLSKNEHTKNLFINKKDNEKETVIEIAQEIISDIDSINACITNNWSLFRTIKNKVYPPLFGKVEDFNIPENILEKCNIKETYKKNIMSITPFIKNISLLKNKFNNQFIDERRDYIELLNKDNNFAYQTVLNIKNEISNNILYIYRFRNLIVHNANVGHTLLHYYTEKAKVYAIHLFLEIMILYSKDNTLTPMEALLKIKLKKELTLEKLKNTRINSFFEILTKE